MNFFSLSRLLVFCFFFAFPFCFGFVFFPFSSISLSLLAFSLFFLLLLASSSISLLLRLFSFPPSSRFFSFSSLFLYLLLLLLLLSISISLSNIVYGYLFLRASYQAWDRDARPCSSGGTPFLSPYPKGSVISKTKKEVFSTQKKNQRERKERKKSDFQQDYSLMRSTSIWN